MIKREIEKQLIDHLNAKEITLIVGPRQAGKTFIMRRIKDYLDKKGENSILFALDYEEDKKYFVSQESLINKLKLEFKDKKAFVFIDEIQRKENAGIYLKGIYDLELPYKFIVSGSGSIELKEKIHESLMGRKRIFALDTVSFLEFAIFKTNYKYEENIVDFFKIEDAAVMALLDEYLNYGGYPRVILEGDIREKHRIIDEIIASYLEKDIVYLLRLAKPDVFTMLLRIIAGQSGMLLNYSKIASSVQISASTLKNYLWYAEKTFVLKMLRPFFRNFKKEISKSPCAYFTDLGVRNYLIGGFGSLNTEREKGLTFQNFIFNILNQRTAFSGYSLNFWRTIDKAEVDFIISKGQIILPIEVKYSAMARPHLKRSLHSFIEKYSPNEAIVVNLNLKEEIKIKNTIVKFIPFYELLWLPLP